MNLKEEAANTNWVALVLLVLIVGILAFGIYWWQKQNTVDMTPVELTPTATPTPTSTVSPTATTTPTVKSTKKVTKTESWKQYFDNKNNYQIDYPHKLAVDGKYGNEDWEAVVGNAETYDSVYFGPPSTRPGGHVWGVEVHKKSEGLEKMIKEVGSQCDSRKESRSNIKIDGRSAILVTVNCKFSDGTGFISKAVYITKGNKIYVIGGGDEKEFSTFYKSFKFIG